MLIAPIINLESHDRLVATLAFSRDGTRLASGAQDCRAIVQDVSGSDTPPPPRIIRHLGGSVRVAAFDAQAAHLLTEGGNGVACVHSLLEDKPPALLSAFHEDSEARVLWAAWSPDGDEVAAIVSNDGVYLFPLRNPAKYRVLWGLGSAERVMYSPSGKQVLGLYAQGPILFDRNGKKQRRLGEKSSLGECAAAAFSPSGEHIAVAYGPQLSLHRADKAQSTVIAHHDGYVTALDFSADGELLLSGSRDKTVRIFAVKTGKELALLRHDAAVLEARLSPDQKWIGALTEQGALWLWRIDDPTQPPRGLVTLSVPDDSITALAFDPAQPRLAIGWDYGRVHCLSLHPTELAGLPAHFEAERLAAQRARTQPFTTALTWRRTDDADYPYEARVGRSLWSIGVNDWPAEETPYTLFTDDGDPQDFETWPACWKRPE